jgi:hypothetical protein
MAGTEPPAEVSGLAQGYAAKMRAVGNHDQPLFVAFRDAGLIRLGILELGEWNCPSAFDFFDSTMPYEHR